jgi:hypothetical protein
MNMHNETNTNEAVVAETVANKELLSVTLEKLGETMGDYKPYDSQLPIVDIEGTRIVKCLYQVAKATGKKVAENSYVRIPVKHMTEEVIVERIAELSPYVLGWLQELEDGMIKDDHKAGILSVYTEGLSLDKIVEKLEAAEAGARLNKEKIEEWFVDALADSLTVKFAEKMRLHDDSSLEELEKLELVILAYRKKFASLASPKVMLKEEDCLAMIAVIKQCEAEGSLIGKRFVGKLEKMQKREEEVLMSL